MTTSALSAAMNHFWWPSKRSSVFFVSVSATSYALFRRPPRSSVANAEDLIVGFVRTTVRTSPDEDTIHEWSRHSFRATRYRRICVADVLDWLKFVEYVQVKSLRLTRRAWPRRASLNRSRWLLFSLTFKLDPMTIRRSHLSLSIEIVRWKSTGRDSPKNTISGLRMASAYRTEHFEQCGIVCWKMSVLIASLWTRWKQRRHVAVENEPWHWMTRWIGQRCSKESMFWV